MKFDKNIRVSRFGVLAETIYTSPKNKSYNQKKYTNFEVSNGILSPKK